MKQVKVLELFAGIGACSKALTNLGIEHEIVDAVEIDKYAIRSFNAIHGTSFEPQDITKWDKDIECDIIMHGSPCQDFSIAGRQAGGDEGSGTRSSLMYETLRIVEKLKPKVVIWENVKNLLSKKHRHNFDAYIGAMRDMGYNSCWQVLNAKDYGVPQNRERVFTVSLAAGWPGEFAFPPKQELTKRLKDVLEDNVDDRFYIKDASSLTIGTSFDMINGGTVGKMHDISRRAYHEDSIAPAMHTCQGGNTEPKISVSVDVSKTVRASGRGSMDRHTWDVVAVPIKTANKKGYDMATDGDGIDLAYPESKTRRGRVGHGVAKTIPTNDSQGTLDGFRIRKLTPRECWRLMGFDDADFDKVQAAGISNTQLYKQAGNSIVVDCLERILNNLLIEKEEE